MAYTRIIPAEAAYTPEGLPYSPQFADIYHSASGALAQSRHVFLGGNGLIGAAPRWQRQPRFTILETGFGLGLNFLATWRAWAEDPQRPDYLHYVAVEKHPWRQDDIRRIYAHHKEITQHAPSEAQALADAWPLPLAGIHRLHFAGGCIQLTLALGDAQAVLPQLCLAADALYLDGFMPRRNPDMWSESLCAQLYRLAAPGATLATWSVAGALMRRLQAHGFTVSQAPGLPPKHAMLIGRKPGMPPQAPALPRQVAVIGAGLAGSSIAQRLQARGITVRVFDALPGAGQGASGNPAGMFRPLPMQDDTPMARGLRAAFLYASAHFAAMPQTVLRWQRCGVLHQARDARHAAIQERIIHTQLPPAEYATWVDQEAASALAGVPVVAGGWWFAQSGWVAPGTVCQANLADVARCTGKTIAQIGPHDAGWQLLDAQGNRVMHAEAVVLANGADLPALASTVRPALPLLPIRRGRGVVSFIPTSGRMPLRCVVARQGYVLPAVDGVHGVGATLDLQDEANTPHLADHIENLRRLELTLPGWGAGLEAGKLSGRTGFRPMSPDRLPVLGKLMPGLWVLGGFGARGMVWSAWCAELLAAQMCAEPWSAEADLAAALHPLRFAERARRRAAYNGT